MTLVDFKNIDFSPKEPKGENLECRTLTHKVKNSNFGIFEAKIPKVFDTFVCQSTSCSSGGQIHYYSFGNFSIMPLIFHYLDKIGSAEVLMSTYSISHNSLNLCLRKQQAGVLRRIRFIVDNRVRSLSPKPFDIMAKNFEYRTTSIHAKVACIWNEEHQIVITTSQNATNNPKIERGTVSFDKEIFEFDYNILEDIYERGTT